MARKDHLVTIQEEDRTSKQEIKRNNAILFQAVQPTIANQINGIGATSKTPDEVKDTKFPILNPIDPIGKNTDGTVNVDLSLENSPFTCIELSDVGATISAITINLLNLVKNKAEKFILDITKDPGNVSLPTVTFVPTVENLPAGFPDNDPRYLLEIVARETPTETRFEVVASGGAVSQTPWISNIDADNFSLLDLGLIEITGATGDNVRGKLSISGTDFVIESPLSGDQMKFRVHDGVSVVDILTLTGGLNLKTLTFGGVEPVIHRITQTSNVYTINVPTGYSIEHQINSVTELALTSTSLVLNGNNILATGNIRPNGAGFDIGESGFQYDNLWIDGIATIDEIVLGTAAGEGLGSDMVPDVDQVRIIGAVDRRFSGVFTDVIRFPETTGDTTTRIGQTSGNLEYRVKQNDAHLFKNVNENMMQIFRTGTGTAKWAFGDVNKFIENLSDRINITVPAGDIIAIRSGTADIMSFDNSVIAAQEVLRFRTFNDAARPTPSAAGAGAVFYSNQSGDNFLLYSDGTNWRNVHDNATT